MKFSLVSTMHNGNIVCASLNEATSVKLPDIGKFQILIAKEITDVVSFNKVTSRLHFKKLENPVFFLALRDEQFKQIRVTKIGMGMEALGTFWKLISQDDDVQKFIAVFKDTFAEVLASINDADTPNLNKVLETIENTLNKLNKTIFVGAAKEISKIFTSIIDRITERISAIVDVKAPADDDTN